MKILILSLSASEPSVSRVAAFEFNLMLKTAAIETDLIDIRNLPPIWVDKRDLANLPSEYQELNRATTDANGVVMFFPIHCYSMSGGAKAITEIIGDALTRKPVALVSAAGSMRSHLAVRDLMASMIFEQETICFPKSVQLTEADLSKQRKLQAPIRQRLQTLASEFVDFTNALIPFVNSHPGT
jgi:NAD(P)H-dependent FMN reductase